MHKNHLNNVTLETLTTIHELLISNEPSFDAFIEWATIPIALLSMSGICLKMNNAFTAITGFKREDLLNTNLYQLAYKNDCAFLLDSIADLLKSDLLFSQFEKRWMHHSGVDIWAQINLSIVRGSQEQPSYCLMQVVDHTKLKQVEADLRKTKMYLESFMNNTTDAICVLDKNEGVISVNASFEQMYGWKQEDLIGKVSPNYMEIQSQYGDMHQLLKMGKQISGVEILRKRQDGAYMDVNATLTPVIDDTGDIVAYTGIFRDITERKRTEELLYKSDKLSVAGQLAAGLAHEIRNPLTSLRGFLQLLQADANSKKHYFDIMLSELDRINSIVSEFLVIARPDDYHYTESNLLEILQSVLALLETQALLCGIQLHLHYQTTNKQILCSNRHLKQLFINLIKNAIEASPKDSEIHIEVLMWNDEHVHIRTKDRGIGISQEKIVQLGQPFFTTKEKGTGLGLMMCFKIVEAHQGTLKITSKPGYGTMADVMLPMKLGFEQKEVKIV